MDDKELTNLFTEYASLLARLDELKEKIETEVMARARTVEIAGVRATYYKPSAGTPLYEEAARKAMPEGFDLTPFTTVITTVAWKAVCEKLGVEPSPGEPRPARVVIKVKEEPK